MESQFEISVFRAVADGPCRPSIAGFATFLRCPPQRFFGTPASSRSVRSSANPCAHPFFEIDVLRNARFAGARRMPRDARETIKPSSFMRLAVSIAMVISFLTPCFWDAAGRCDEQKTAWLCYEWHFQGCAPNRRRL